MLVSHTAAMMPAAAVLALDPGTRVAGVAQFTGAIWQVMLCSSEIVFQ